MKKDKILSALFLALTTSSLLISAASANSSWVWVSETRPYDVLPFVIIATLLIETLAVNYLPGIQNLPQVFWRVALGNVLSFAMPYLGAAAGVGPIASSFLQSYEKYPYYHVGTMFLIVTLAVELPVVFTLCRYTERKKDLLFTILAANLVTTVLTALVERTLCYGHW